MKYQFKLRNNVTKLAKLFRSHGYKVSQKTTVCADSYPTEFDLLPFHKDGSLVCKRTAKAVEVEQTAYQRLFKNREQQRRKFALDIAEMVHRDNSLYRSQRGRIVVGSVGGQEERDYNAYSKSYGHPAVWRNAGVTYNNGQVRVYNYLGKEVFSMPLPTLKQMKSYMASDFNMSGVVYGKKSSHGMWRMFDIVHKEVGFAKRMLIGTVEYWEHGNSLDEILSENAVKQAKEAERVQEETKAKTYYRAMSLAKKLVNNIEVTLEDAKEVGYCNLGITNFINRYNNGNKKMMLGQLKEYEEAKMLVHHMLGKTLKPRFA